jgi:hypothetical protein
MGERGHTKGLIVTDHVFPPIPVRQFDWCAWLDGQEEAGPRGWGETEAQAIDALLEELCADRGLTSDEMKAQGKRCGCGGSDDYCGCQNLPDRVTLGNWKSGFQLSKATPTGEASDV